MRHLNCHHSSRLQMGEVINNMQMGEVINNMQMGEVINNMQMFADDTSTFVARRRAITGRGPHYHNWFLAKSELAISNASIMNMMTKSSFFGPDLSRPSRSNFEIWTRRYTKGVCFDTTVTRRDLSAVIK